ncbi:hypothetical protein [Rufibacter soli]
MPDSAKIVRLEEKVKYLEDRASKSEQKISDLEGLVSVYQASTGQVKNKLDQIYNAIIGDEMGNIGLVKRVANIETVIAWINAKKSTIVGGVAALGAAGAGGYWLFEKIIAWLG